MRSALRQIRLAQGVRSVPRTRLTSLRTYATLSPDTPPPQSPYEVFDEPSKFRQRDRALLRLNEKEEKGSGVVDYLREEIAERLAERIEVCPASMWCKQGEGHS